MAFEYTLTDLGKQMRDQYTPAARMSSGGTYNFDLNNILGSSGTTAMYGMGEDQAGAGVTPMATDQHIRFTGANGEPLMAQKAGNDWIVFPLMDLGGTGFSSAKESKLNGVPYDVIGPDGTYKNTLKFSGYKDTMGDALGVGSIFAMAGGGALAAGLGGAGAAGAGAAEGAAGAGWGTGAAGYAGLDAASAASLGGGASGAWGGGLGAGAGLGGGAAGYLGDASAAGYGGLDAASTATMGGGASGAYGGAAGAAGGTGAMGAGGAAGSSLIPGISNSQLLGAGTSLLGGLGGGQGGAGGGGAAGSGGGSGGFLDPRMTPYLYDTPSGLMPMTQGLLAEQAPRGQAMSELTANLGQRMLNQPIAGNGYGQVKLNAPTTTTNPYLTGMADDIGRRTNELLGQNNLAIQGNSVASGGLGGSRQGVAQGLAAGKAADYLQGNLSSLYGTQYNNDQNRALQQYGMDQSFYGNQRGQDLSSAQLGSGLLSQSQSLAFDPLKNASEIYRPFSGLNSAAGGSSGSGGTNWQGVAGGLLGGAQFAKNMGWW